MQTLPTKYKRKNGFSLIELAVVILIIGLLVSFSIKVLSDTVSAVRYSDTRKKLNEVKESLNKFYQANARLPCPAQLNLKAEDTNYGVEIYSESYSPAPSPTGCDRAAAPANSADPTGILSIDNGSGVWIRQGALPIKALNLANDMMYDSYGNKFTYVISETFTSGSISAPSTSDGAITINDGVTPTTITSKAVYALISHGADQKGAYSASGSLMAICSSTLGRDNENCDGDSSISDAQFNDLNRNSSTWFDDIVIWGSKNEIMAIEKN